MQNRILAAFLAALSLLTAAPAPAQQFPQTLPANTVFGRLGIGPGPGQAIPFTTLAARLPGLPRVYNVTDYDVRCDGTTDDTTALQLLGATIQANGGKARIWFPPGATCVIYNSGQSLATALFTWSSIGNIRVDGGGATLRVGATFTVSDVLRIFNLNIANNVTVDGLNVTQTNGVTVGGASPYGTEIVSCANGCSAINLTNSTLTGGFAPYLVSNTLGGYVFNVRSVNSFYGVGLIDGFGSAFPDASTGIVIRGLSTLNVDRSLFIKGARDIDASFVSQNSRANDLLITSDSPSFPSENLRINYKVLPRTAGTAASYVTIGNASGCACPAAIYRNIRVNFDIDMSGDAAIYPAIKFIKGSTSALGILFEDIQIGGRIHGVPNVAGSVVNLFDPADAPWSGETANNVIIGPLYITGSATPDFFVDFNTTLSTGAPIVLRDVKGPGTLTRANEVPGAFAAFNTKFSNFITNDNAGLTGRGDANYTILATDRVIPITAPFTAARTFTLPSVATMAPGSTIWVHDITTGGALTSSNTLTIARAGSDTINQALTSITFQNPGSVIKITASPANARWDVRQVSFSGTSGGVPYFNSATTQSSSALLTQFGPVYGGGAAAAPVAMAAGTDGQVVVGQTGAAPLWKTMSGDCTLAAAGAITCTKVNGVTHPSSMTSGGVMYASSTSAVASSALLTANAIVLGGGAGTAPAALGSLGTTTTVLHGNAGGAPTFGAVVSADLNITTTSCTNQFVSAVSAGGVGTCSSPTYPFAGGNGSSLLTAGNTQYMCQAGPGTGGTGNFCTVPAGGTLKNLYVNVAPAPGVGQTYTVFVYTNAQTAITCVISGASATTCNDTTHTVAIAAGGVFAIQAAASAGAASTGLSFGLGFTSP